MATQVSSAIVTELQSGPTTFQIVDYSWQAEEELIDCEAHYQLKWRISPNRVKARGLTVSGHQPFGRIVFHPADVPTYIRGAGERESSRMLICKFERASLETIAGRILDFSDPALFNIFDLRDSNIDYSMRRVVSEILAPSFASGVVLESMALVLAADILRILVTSPKQQCMEAGALTPKMLHDIHDFVEHVSDVCPKTADIAKHCGFSVGHLDRLYKAATGRTLCSMINEVRVRRARELLLDTDIPIKVISYRMGFKHPGAFSFAFKRATGNLPSEYRKCSAHSDSHRWQSADFRHPGGKGRIKR